MSSSRSVGQRLAAIFAKFSPSLLFLVLIFGALIAFEIFNYSTTDHALQDLLGNLEFGSLHWSTILAFAFCGIDFAGIARLFTPQQGLDEPKEVWYLFGAWLLAATMNAILTWWGVSMAVVNHQIQSATIVDAKTISTVVPVFVATMVWVIRILIIGTLSMAMDRALHTDRPVARRSSFTSPQPALAQRTSAPAASSQPILTPRTNGNRPFNPMPEPRYARSGGDFNGRNNASVAEPAVSRGMPEPTYHSRSMSGSNQNPAPVGDRPSPTVSTLRRS